MKKMLFLVLYTVFLNIPLVRGQTYTSVISTASGPIRGLISTTIRNFTFSAFKGIPFAKPPIGYLRFKPPEPVNAWTNVYSATTEGSTCIQFYPSQPNSVLGAEDCLYMNIYTPHTKFNGSISKPVMVWIYGGGFQNGWSNQSTYGPDLLLDEDVIVVSFNYRLNALGFLNLEHENATGNCGMKDQNLALKWIKRNIANFGGDPNKITIFGESAGSVSVDLHVLSDMSVGLFNQSISMSGSPLVIPWGYQSSHRAIENALTLGSKLGTNTTSKDVLLKNLYNASAADIVAAANGIELFPFRPSIEKSDIATDQEKFLTKCSLSKYIAGNYTKGPHMMGFMASESLLFWNSLAEFFTTTQLALETLENATSIMPFLSDLTNEIITGMSNMTVDARHRLVEETSDLFFNLGIDTKQRYISRNNDHPIYYYRFSFVSNYTSDRLQNIGFNEATHADEMPYLFHTSNIQFPLDQPDIAATSQRFVKLFTNFAKYGNPTPDGINDSVLGITWPDSRPDGAHLDIGKKLTTGPRPTSNFVRMLQIFGLGNSPVLNDCTNN